jgi:acyl transferase domain-containing protein
VLLLLVAVDLACKAILNGACDYALAGGVNVIIKPEMTIAMSKATMLSRDGRCKSFDSRADGYVRGEGAGLVVLRRLSHARAAGNPIYAIIRGSGVNSDGLTKGISVPNGDAQEALTRRVLKEAGVRSSTIAYVEAHGTGTPVGDPIEATALGRVFSEGRGASDGPLLLGSVRPTSGISSRRRCRGADQGGAVSRARRDSSEPPLSNAQPRDRLRLVEAEGGAAEAAMAGGEHAASRGGELVRVRGTNAHVILEQAPDGPPAPVSELLPAQRLVLPMGARDAGALRPGRGIRTLSLR